MEGRYYEVSIPTGTIWVPEKAPKNTLRKITPKGELPKYRALLATRPVLLEDDFRRRQASLLERLKLKTFRSRCELLRDLSAHSKRKPLNEACGQVLRRTMYMVRDEWAMAAELSPGEAAQEIEALLQRGRREHASEN
jgi:RNA polymerase-interacting CarD/CdnL/TRCF family regulator